MLIPLKPLSTLGSGDLIPLKPFLGLRLPGFNILKPLPDLAFELLIPFKPLPGLLFPGF